MSELEPCTRCGKCCESGGICTFRRWGGYGDEFAGICELLEKPRGKKTSCRAIAEMSKRPDPCSQRALDSFVGYGCQVKEMTDPKKRGLWNE